MEDRETQPVSGVKRRFRVWMPLIGALLVVFGMFVEWLIIRPAELTPGEKKLREIYGIITEKYVDEVSVDSLVELTIPSMLSSLDPHTVYLSAKDRQVADEELDGEFSGVGVQFRVEDGRILIAEVISGGPCEKVGVLAGDYIVAVDGEELPSMTFEESEGLKKKLRGEKGTHVVLTIERPGLDGTIDFDVVRDDIKVTSVDAAFMLDETTGYIRLNRFARDTYAEFQQAIAGLDAKGATDYVLDLRGNVGGYVAPALLVANDFLDQGRTIVSTRGRNPELDETVRSDGFGSHSDVGLVVLIDGFTASASEIFSGAMQDNDRALIVGQRSFGKGLVQEPINLKDGSELRLTIQRYYTPSGRSIQKSYKLGQADKYNDELFERYSNGEIFELDSTKFDRNLVYKTGTGRPVYGGGGIIPDIFVPNDTSEITTYYADVVRRGLLQKFASEYVSLNRATLQKAKSVREMLRLLPSDDILIGSFADFARMNGVAPRWYYINISRKLIVNQLKALIARDVFGISGYYEVYSRIDVDVRKALEAIRSGKAEYPIMPE